MEEKLEKPGIITSDPKVLRQIKYLQFRRQLLPIIFIAAILALNIFLRQNYMMYPAILAFAWYIWERILWRTKNKIAAPEEGSFVSPVNGRITAIHKTGEHTEIVINKSVIDVVELRLPYTGLRMESNRNWYFDTLKGQINLRIESDRIVFFENKDIAGDVIGVLPGSSNLTLIIPAQIQIHVKKGMAVLGGETVLFSLYEADAAPVSILVEKPIEEIDADEGV